LKKLRTFHEITRISRSKYAIGTSGLAKCQWANNRIVVEVPVARNDSLRRDCAAFVLELQPEATMTGRKRNAKWLVVIGSYALLLFPVTLDFALANRCTCTRATNTLVAPNLLVFLLLLRLKVTGQ
jgi:hypothetical protein